MTQRRKSRFVFFPGPILAVVHLMSVHRFPFSTIANTRSKVYQTIHTLNKLKDQHCWLTMMVFCKKKIGPLFEKSIGHLKQQILSNVISCASFEASDSQNIRKTGKYGLGFRSCYHVRISDIVGTLMFTKD